MNQLTYKDATVQQFVEDIRKCLMNGIRPQYSLKTILEQQPFFSFPQFVYLCDLEDQNRSLVYYLILKKV